MFLDQSDLQEALLKTDEDQKPPVIQRKVSFREHPVKYCPECQMEQQQLRISRPNTPASHSINGSLPPVQKAIVKSFSIDKLRPLCPVCNPVGDVPYPTKDCSLQRPNNNFSDPEVDPNEDEVKKLNSELEELQKCLINGAADLAAFEDTKL